MGGLDGCISWSDVWNQVKTCIISSEIMPFVCDACMSVSDSRFLLCPNMTPAVLGVEEAIIVFVNINLYEL